MPFKFETLKINLPPQLDRRRKLSEEEKEKIKELYSVVSQRKLAKQFNVSRTLIVFLGDPEKHAENLKRRKERGGWSQYYDPKKHRKYTKKTRQWKQKLMREGKLQSSKLPKTFK